MGKLAGESLELCKLGGIQPSENSIMYSEGRGLACGQLSLCMCEVNISEVERLVCMYRANYIIMAYPDTPNYTYR